MAASSNFLPAGAAAAQLYSKALPAAHFRVNYLPEGYPMLPQTVVLRPVAEQTGSSSTAWYFLFEIERKDR